MSDVAARRAIERWLPTVFDGWPQGDPTDGSTYFHQPANQGFIIGNRVPTVRIENYQFYKDDPIP